MSHSAPVAVSVSQAQSRALVVQCIKTDTDATDSTLVRSASSAVNHSLLKRERSSDIRYGT
eukprot:scaffold8011_cov146-Isochrysis_galbana.AAC.6